MAHTLSKVMRDHLDAHVVVLVNFIAPNDAAVFQELSHRIRKVTILSSVAMEANRQWESDHGDLDVVVGRTWTITRTDKHPSGYQDTNYVHIPLDTIRQLKKLSPDIVVSMELGARTALALRYRKRLRRTGKQVPVIAAINASERTEASRGKLRTRWRKRLLKQLDWLTYNGPSCYRYLLSLGVSSDRMSPWDYAADPRKPYRGDLTHCRPSAIENGLHLLTVGQLSDRKGVLAAHTQLSEWCHKNPTQLVNWNLVGTGPLKEQLSELTKPENLVVKLHGHCEPDDIQKHYRDNDLMLFPTLGDEWGLVVDESLHSGLPVIGSIHAQSVEMTIQTDVNGWHYDPSQCEDPRNENQGRAGECKNSLMNALDRFISLTPTEIRTMRRAARDSVATRTPANSADQLVNGIKSVQSSCPNRTF